LFTFNKLDLMRVDIRDDDNGDDAFAHPIPGTPIFLQVHQLKPADT
jgi:hypothetical protein